MLLVLIMLMSMGNVAFAANTATTPADTTSVDLTVLYRLENGGTKSPAETVNFIIKKESVTDSQLSFAQMPEVNSGSAKLNLDEGAAEAAPGKENNLSINLPTYTSVGIYTYKITMKEGTQAGVRYDPNPYYLKVTVTQGENGLVRSVTLHKGAVTGAKSENLENLYSAGDLFIKKNVTGNMGDKDKYFAVKVTLTGEQGKIYAENYTVTGGTKIVNGTDVANESTITVDGQEHTFYVKDTEEIKIGNLPYGVTWTVKEDDYRTEDKGKYDAATYKIGETVTGNEGKDIPTGKIGNSSTSVTITNNKGISVDTGINMDNLPYILMIAFVIVSLSVFFVRRRMAREY